MDNMVASTYLKIMGGGGLHSNGIMITVEYCSSALNKLDDLESQCRTENSEWILCKDIFRNLCLKLGIPEIYLFASKVSLQLPKYVAWNLNPCSIAIDVLSVPWTQGSYYAFPTFCFILRVLSKILNDHTHTVILITPCWQTILWYPKVLNMLIASPMLIKLPKGY